MFITLNSTRLMALIYFYFESCNIVDCTLYKVYTCYKILYFFVLPKIKKKKENDATKLPIYLFLYIQHTTQQGILLTYINVNEPKFINKMKKKKRFKNNIQEQQQ